MPLIGVIENDVPGGALSIPPSLQDEEDDNGIGDNLRTPAAARYAPMRRDWPFARPLGFIPIAGVASTTASTRADFHIHAAHPDYRRFSLPYQLVEARPLRGSPFGRYAA